MKNREDFISRKILMVILSQYKNITKWQGCHKVNDLHSSVYIHVEQ